MKIYYEKLVKESKNANQTGMSSATTYILNFQPDTIGLRQPYQNIELKSFLRRIHALVIQLRCGLSRSAEFCGGFKRIMPKQSLVKIVNIHSNFIWRCRHFLLIPSYIYFFRDQLIKYWVPFIIQLLQIWEGNSFLWNIFSSFQNCLT